MSYSGRRGSGQMSRASSGRPGFAVRFFDRINQSWPHGDHKMSNGATDATAAQWAIPCLFSHLPPDVNIVVLDFGSMAQYLDRGAVETIVRQLLSLETEPVLIILSVRSWCTFEGRHPMLRDLNEKSPWTLAEDMCHRVCLHYGVSCISVHRALEPLVRAGLQGFEVADVVQPDCLHVIESNHGVHYISQFLEHWLDKTSSLWSLTGRQTGLPKLPPPMDARNMPPPTARCFAFSSDGNDHGNGEAEEDVQGAHQNWRSITWRSAWCPLAPPSALPDAPPGVPLDGSCSKFNIMQCPTRLDDDLAYQRLVASPPKRWFFCRRSLSPSARKLSPGIVALVAGAIVRVWLPLGELVPHDQLQRTSRRPRAHPQPRGLPCCS